MLALDQIVQGIEGSGFALQEQLLDPDQLQALRELSEQRRSEFKPALVGKTLPQRQFHIRGDYTLWLDPLSYPPELRPVMENLTHLQHHLNEQFFLGLKQYECHFARYPVGAHYQKHLDAFQQDSSRIISFVFYLNQDWSEQDGGELVLYDHQGKVSERIIPRGGSFVCFLSRELPHAVLSAGRERLSITGWMHNKLLY